MSANYYVRAGLSRAARKYNWQNIVPEIHGRVTRVAVEHYSSGISISYETVVSFPEAQTAQALADDLRKVISDHCKCPSCPVEEGEQVWIVQISVWCLDECKPQHQEGQ